MLVPWISVGHLLDNFAAPKFDEFKLYADSDAFDVWVQDCDKSQLGGLVDKLCATDNFNITMKASATGGMSKIPQLVDAVKKYHHKQDWIISCDLSPLSARKEV